MEASIAGRLADRWGNSMGAKDDYRPTRHLIKGLYKNGSPRRKVFNHVTVMDYFLAHIHRPTEVLQCQFHYFDSPNHTGTKPPGLKQQQGCLVGRGQVFSFSS
jgi:hypothetical protein